ncbi:S41 family peptidase [Aquiflexum gelatinilyticum]|uniref:S41 family peptidase n=1 Tax=Aquiflexum gelatinilyticum TaxID=2961943 RepID=UPI00216A36D8|nr:S41 family peptidase [Aquiflexum gelatinilyticum]MCS4433414.1 S41 family peptidase [Aquiflexum gelatinilyticum]
MKKLLIQIGALIVFTSCESMMVDQPATNPEAIFENIWQTFEEEYAPFDERNVDWEAEYQRFRPMVSSATSEDELFDIISGMLETLDDGHVTLTAPDKNLFVSNKIRREKIDDGLFDTEMIRSNYLEPGFRVGDEESFIYGKIKGQNIGYIFFDYVSDNLFVMDDFLAENENADGLIIDMRHNDGGDFTYAFSEIGRLVDQTRLVFRSKTKNGKGQNDFTPWFDWSIHPSGNFIDIPIVVLTDRFTISAGERMVMAFMTLPNALTMGDTTNGAHGTMIGRELANGWFYSLVPQKVELFDGKSYEGIGLAPDVFVKNNLPDVLAGKDETLETAIEEINN